MTPQEPQEMPEELPELQITDLTMLPLLPAEEDYGTAASEEPPREERKSRSISTRPPTAEEWQDFLGGTVLRLLTEGYLYMVLFRYVDESDLSPREREMTRLTKEELREIAAPVATVASKNKLARKHGRTVIASAESYESLIDLFFWAKRVSKIARKYRPVKGRAAKTPAETVEGTVFDGPVPGTDEGTAFSRDGGLPNFGGIVPGTGG